MLTVELEVAVDAISAGSTFKTSTRCRQIRMGCLTLPERFGREVLAAVLGVDVGLADVDGFRQEPGLQVLGLLVVALKSASMSASVDSISVA